VPLELPKIETEEDVRKDIKVFNGVTSEELLKRLFGAPYVAIDIETTGLRPYADGKILTVAVSYDDINLAVAWDHPKTQGVVPRVWLESLLADPKIIKIAHNTPFEVEWFINEFGLDWLHHDSWEDTMMQAHFLDERVGGMSLDFLCKQHFGVAYKSFFKLDKKNMAMSDLQETLVYNAVDTKYTLRLWHLQNRLLKERGLYEAYKATRARQPTVAIMQHLGIDVDQAKVQEFQGVLGEEIAELHTQINDINVVKKYKADKGEFNPQGEDVLAIFRDYLKRKEIHVQDGERLRLSTDRKVLEKIDHPLAKLIVELRQKAKLKSTYVDGLVKGAQNGVVWPDGKIHTSFNTCFTETGRTSSDSPNMQNFPHRRDAWVRRQVVSPRDSYLVAFDFGQLEVCTAAILSKDAYLIKALWEDLDMHMDWAKRLVRLHPAVCPDFDDPAEAKKLRGVVKGALVFASLYGAGEPKVASGLGIPHGVAEKLLERFWKELSGLKRWQEQIIKKYYASGYVQTPLGRQRQYPLSKEQIVNFPLQSFAADIVCTAMVSLSKRAIETGKWYLHPVLNVHDDLTFVIPKNVLEEAVEEIYTTMLTPPWPDLINVPLTVTGAIGENWYEMKEIGKFSSKELK
jgi:DNA polymerase I-like protein with 3'-5' exonuclease and polymerase domains